MNRHDLDEVLKLVDSSVLDPDEKDAKHTPHETPEANADHAISDSTHANIKAYEAFVRQHAEDAEFKDKYVAFVHGKYGGSDTSEIALVCRMYDRFGNVEMYVDKLQPDEQTHMMATLPWPNM